MPTFATFIQKASWPVSWVLFRGEPPKAPSPRMTTAAIRLHAGKLFSDLDREEIIDGDERQRSNKPLGEPKEPVRRH